MWQIEQNTLTPVVRFRCVFLQWKLVEPMFDEEWIAYNAPFGVRNGAVRKREKIEEKSGKKVPHIYNE